MIPSTKVKEKTRKSAVPFDCSKLRVQGRRETDMVCHNCQSMCNVYPTRFIDHPKSEFFDDLRELTQGQLLLYKQEELELAPPRNEPQESAGVVKEA